jgi:hypothetical protein
MNTNGKDFFRPRGDITTVLDLTDRDAQDMTFFPIDSEESWFHREVNRTVYPTTMSIQEFIQRGPADWGQKCTFELGSLPAGDLLQTVMLQFKLGTWYPPNAVTALVKGEQTVDPLQDTAQYWTYANSLGSAIIEYADFIVKDQTIERITGEFIRAFYNVYADVNVMTGLSTDAIGAIPFAGLSMDQGQVQQTAFHPRRLYPTEDGTYFCVLPFFFSRTRLKEVFPLLSCQEGDVRIDIKLRPFDDLVRRTIGWREQPCDTPLQRSVSLRSATEPVVMTTYQTATVAPSFREFRIVSSTCYTMGTIRDRYLRKPFEQLIKPVQIFHFDEPLKYLTSKSNAGADVVDIQFPLELNHPVAELLWVFRRKACRLNNEWANFTPEIGWEAKKGRIVPPWLVSATIRMNGIELVSEEGEWFRQHIAQVHKGGLVSYSSHMYGYSFARFPSEHQPSGTVNTSRTHSISLGLSVRTPIEKALDPACTFDSATVRGWEVFVFAVQYNWLRFENGLCQKVFQD